MQEIIGQFLLMIMKLLKEFNEEFLEQAIKELNIRPEDIKPDGWYPVDETVIVLEKLSDDANHGVGKLIVVANPALFTALKPDATPADLISLLKTEISKNFKGENIFSLLTVVDSGPGMLVVKTKMYPFTESFVKGLISGFMQILKILKIHTIKTDEDGFQVFTVKWQ